MFSSADKRLVWAPTSALSDDKRLVWAPTSALSDDKSQVWAPTSALSGDKKQPTSTIRLPFRPSDPTYTCI